MSGPPPLRAVGVRIGYDDVPAAVRDWVERTCGSIVVDAATQRGGMSPGCAARLLFADGSRVFVKAVGSELNPLTPGLFRHEGRVLAALPAVPWRATLRASYDDGDWVALMLDDVAGRHPDWTAAGDVSAVLAAVERQTRELTPAPVGLETGSARDVAVRWLETFDTAAPADLDVLPSWVRQNAALAHDLLESLPDLLDGETLCHWDVRNDNLLIRPDGSAVTVDWGVARRGPAWGDTTIFALEWADSEAFDTIVATAATTRDLRAETLTGFLLGIGIHLTILARQPAPPGLPTLPEFRRREAARFLEGAHRRLRLR